MWVAVHQVVWADLGDNATLWGVYLIVELLQFQEPKGDVWAGCGQVEQTVTCIQITRQILSPAVVV